ncbi:MAG: arsenite efflux transporter metallochaperone ArsD [Ancrocorticia sp.]|jgi:uncharacterized membrane protein YgcG|nr:arsenite efflux transporter metallochaperone ArsD [Ancrocorticia sp.]
MISVFEGPLCCNTGVCGTDPDQALVQFTADADWMERQGVEVHRANLAQDPQAFADSAIARSFMQVAGAEGLPLTLVDGVTVMTGRYPSREELAVFAGLLTKAPEQAGQSSCCGGGASSGSSCCGGGAPESVEISTSPVGTSL